MDNDFLVTEQFNARKRRIVIEGIPYTVMVFFRSDAKETGIGKIMQLAKRDIMANPMHKLE